MRIRKHRAQCAGGFVCHHRAAPWRAPEKSLIQRHAFNNCSHQHPNILTRMIRNSLHYYVPLSSVPYGWQLCPQFFRQTILPNVAFSLSKTPQKRLENDSYPQFFITNSSVVHNERSKRSLWMTAFFAASQTTEKHNHLKNNPLREPPKISIFASIFPEAPKYSILRASAPRIFNNQAPLLC